MNRQNNDIERSLLRFNASLDAFEAALMRRRQSRETIKSLENEIQTLTEDRSNLAQELDKVRAYASQLAKINGKADKRLDAAMENIRNVLGNS